MKFYSNVQRHKGDFLVRGYEGKLAYKEKVKVKPYLFIPDKSGNSKYKSLYGDPASKIDFPYISEANQFLEKYKGVENFPIYGMTTWEYPWIFDNFKKGFEYDKDRLSIVYIDIEVASGNGFAMPQNPYQPIILITIRKNDKRYTFGCHDYATQSKDQYYLKCKDEEDLLLKFLTFWKRDTIIPDIISGWNSAGYDLPYLYKRIEKVLGLSMAKKLSPWEIVEERIKHFGKKEQLYVDLVGVAILDMMDLYKDQKFQIPKQENYALDTIAEVELGQKKVDYSEYESLQDFYEKDPQKFTEYNIQDVDLVYEINAKRKLIDFVITIAYTYRMNFEDVFTSVRMWDIIIHNYLLERNIVVPQVSNNTLLKSIEGAYVKEPVPGLYEWVGGFDLSSLYPNLIRTLNISPETFFNKIPNMNADNFKERLKDESLQQFLKANNLTICANGCTYKKDKIGVLPAISGDMFNERSAIRKEMFEVKKKFEKDKLNKILENLIASLDGSQLGRKISLNSLYGILSQECFRFFSTDLAESITITGQFVIKQIEKEINDFLNKLLKTDNKDYVIGMDTDSVYLNLNSIAGKFQGNLDEITNIIDKVCKEKIDAIIKKAIEKIYQFTNAFDKTLSMKRETISNKAIWTAKKKYILNVMDQEGVRHKTPEMKIVGIEAIRTSTPKDCREAMKKLLKIIINETKEKTIEFVENYKKEFYKLPVSGIASPRGVNGLGVYEDSKTIFRKGTPIHTKGALMYNHLIRQKDLQNKYSFITEGEKIKYCYLKEPNPLKINVIAFPKNLPKEFQLEKYISYDMQWQKAFLAPIEMILDIIGWKLYEEATLERFFE